MNILNRVLTIRDKDSDVWVTVDLLRGVCVITDGARLSLSGRIPRKMCQMVEKQFATPKPATPTK